MKLKLRVLVGTFISLFLLYSSLNALAFNNINGIVHEELLAKYGGGGSKGGSKSGSKGGSKSGSVKTDSNKANKSKSKAKKISPQEKNSLIRKAVKEKNAALKEKKKVENEITEIEKD